MNPDHDFSRSPRQCQRRRETGFYCALGCGAALAVAAVMALGWMIESDSARLQAGTLMLQAELKQLQPRLTQVTAMESTIATQQEQLASQVAQATQRAFAPHTLHALASISPVHIRLQQIVMRTDEAEIRGTASGQRQLQDLVESLRSSGLGQVRLQEMQQRSAQDSLASPLLRYSFTLTLSNIPPVTSPAPTPSLPPKSDAAQVQRARRT
ncbi:PilN domain-containing protein [Herbaspirillum sp. alder98]|uniref:PilN domain-containing protein n=1 Tax=Herbaspirillum sp. alder98 TaxID=2913096 RepID=UPI001CD8DBD4|nr:PilN domain-containing protein [Herbaspirillum sp. alder98]MCA1324195.1 PilN domain-containing protein [Herbaspirillum sp. alder98]